MAKKEYNEDLLGQIYEGVYDRLGVRVRFDKKLGCGSYGCAFETDDKDMVCKVSEDPMEAPMSIAIMEEGLDELPGFAKLHGAWKVFDPQGDVFVIMRENILPVSQYKDAYKATDEAPWLGDLLYIKATGDSLYLSEQLNYVPGMLLEALETQTLTMQQHEECLPLFNALVELYDKGLFLWDLHIGNLAIREDADEVEWYDGKWRQPLLTYDYGHSYSPEKLPRVRKLLQNPYYLNLPEVEEL